MSRLRNSIPSCLPHSQSGRARAAWTGPAGVRQFRLLPSRHGSTESRSAFTLLLLELDADPHQPQIADPTGVTVAEVLPAYLGYAERHYRAPDGKPTSEIFEIRVVLRALRDLHADTPVSAFGPLCVKAARQKWINKNRSRTECNRRVSVIKRVFKWAVSEELAPPSVYQAAAAVAGLPKGRTTAPETPPVRPVDNAVVDATLPFLNRHVRGPVALQRLTGCRPGEACVLRRCDIDTSGAVWLYTPPHHKTAREGPRRRRRRAEGAGTDPRILHRRPGGIPVQPASGGRGATRRAVGGAEDAPLAIAHAADRSYRANLSYNSQSGLRYPSR